MWTPPSEKRGAFHVHFFLCFLWWSSIFLIADICSWVRRIVFCAYLKCRDMACRVSLGGNSWNYHIHLMRCAARQLNGETSLGALITNLFHIVHKLQEARRKVCSTTWNSYFTSWNAKVYYILLFLFLLSRAFASKQKFIELTLS